MSDHGEEFDGVICFGGEDWWYHNRGHYDMQMMRELSAHVPVLYVNSIGMRVPRIGEGAMFIRRVRRKLESLRRGLVTVRDGFSVFSPVVIPGRFGLSLGDAALAAQVRRAARRVGIRRPLVWVACPPAARSIARLGPAGIVYQRTDRLEHFHGVNTEEIRGYDRELKGSADLTLFCSTMLHEEEADQCRRAAYIDHGVDYDRFRDAGSEPEDVAPIARPRVGFVGGIDSHTFWPELFLDVAQRLADVEFVLVGGCSLPEGWCEHENVHLLGQKPYEAVPGYMSACDVLIMPWNQNEWIAACNPIKLKEYLAVGRPIVSTPFDELRNYEGLVEVAADAESFAAAIQRGLDAGADLAAMRARVERETWRAKASRVVDELARSGLTPAGGISLGEAAIA